MTGIEGSISWTFDVSDASDELLAIMFGMPADQLRAQMLYGWLRHNDTVGGLMTPQFACVNCCSDNEDPHAWCDCAMFNERGGHKGPCVWLAHGIGDCVAMADAASRVRGGRV